MAEISYYKSRRHQMVDVEKEVRAKKTTLSRALRDACMCGACEERDRVLRIIDNAPLAIEQQRYLRALIVSVSVLRVIGYEKP